MTGEEQHENLVQVLGMAIDGLIATSLLVENSPTKAEKVEVEEMRGRAAGLVARALHNLLHAEVERAIDTLSTAVSDAALESRG